MAISDRPKTPSGVLWGGQSCPQPAFSRPDPLESGSAAKIGHPTHGQLLSSRLSLLSSRFSLLVAAFCLLASATPLAARCALCRSVVAAQNAIAPGVIDKGIIVLFLPAVMVFSAVLVLAFRYRNDGGGRRPPDDEGD